MTLSACCDTKMEIIKQQTYFYIQKEKEKPPYSSPERSLHTSRPGITRAMIPVHLHKFRHFIYPQILYQNFRHYTVLNETYFTNKMANVIIFKLRLLIALQCTVCSKTLSPVSLKLDYFIRNEPSPARFARRILRQKIAYTLLTH